MTVLTCTRCGWSPHALSVSRPDPPYNFRMPAISSRMQRTATAGSFKPGTSGNALGKRPGTANRVTVEAREAATLIVDDPEYRAALKARVIAGQAPHMEVMLWHYAKGKPVDRVEQGGPGAFAVLSDAELRERLLAALDAKSMGTAGRPLSALKSPGNCVALSR